MMASRRPGGSGSIPQKKSSSSSDEPQRPAQGRSQSSTSSSTEKDPRLAATTRKTGIIGKPPSKGDTAVFDDIGKKGNGNSAARSQRSEENLMIPSPKKVTPALFNDPRLLVIAVYFLFQFDSIKEMTCDVAEKLRLYRVRNVLQSFIPSWIINHPSRGMILSLFAGAVGAYTCSRYYSWKNDSGSYDVINIILSGVAGHFAYSSIKMIFMRPEYAKSFYQWVEDLGQTYTQRKTYPPIIPTRK